MVGRLAALALLACGCSSGGNSSGPAGVPRAATLPSLTTQQLGALCDWMVASVGGYGTIANCDGGGAIHIYSDQQSCITKLGGLCPSLTAGAVEDCINATGKDICRTATEPKCVPVNTCSPGDAGMD